ncbi:enoyl-CoA hydratase/isomerase family protein [Pseudoneobacillus rhizosphaerae]|uniref:Ethylmalonyl-CoA decarboxylase n=1 Tax=Pseudoneobacillus rhizosphaerae TaxID=2880968 RepID=A0A9C7G7Q3_9BACI|nr:enoyl-CoA hydratase/isomerase family protein [Pseudoneobacillus rhizosphaerae]CAG9607524.1 Short-chain-enoyl-CoA hydratase [Pseudoneobacillus rhizosphaerae]
MNSYIIEEKTGYLLFTINREDVRNAINYDVMEGIEKLLDMGKDKAYKALVITGAGESAFCSGGDLSAFHQLKTENESYQMLSKMSSILYRLLTYPKPTLAILNGSAVGGGCELASACDFRIGRKGLKAGFIQGKLAITTGWGGGSILLEKLGITNALKLLMTADLYDSEQLLAVGFLNELYDGDQQQACQLYIEKMLKLETEVLSAYKKMVVRKWEETNLQKRIQEEVSNCAKLWQSEAHHQKVTSFLLKNKKM